MRSTDLRTAAARHFLGLTTTGYLLDVAHAALENGIYAHGLGEIITSRDPIFADLGPYFDSALKELGIEVPTWEEAIKRLTEDYMVRIAEGANTPREMAIQAYSDRLEFLYVERQTNGDETSFKSLAQLIDYFVWYERYSDMNDVADQEHLLQLDQGCIALATDWCREHWLPGFDPSWLTTTVVALAQGIRAERAFDRLPILADALQDAGCDHADILDHCRGPGPHVRGCWVVDLVLGKE